MKKLIKKWLGINEIQSKIDKLDSETREFVLSQTEELDKIIRNKLNKSRIKLFLQSLKDDGKI